MLAFICLFFPAVLSLRILEVLNRKEPRPLHRVYHYCTFVLLINLVCIGLYIFVFHTSALFSHEGGDMLPRTAFSYMIVATLIGAFLAVLQALLQRHVSLQVIKADLTDGAKQTQGRRLVIARAAGVALRVFLLFGVLCAFSALWYTRVYGDVGFNAIVNTLLGPLDNVEQGLVNHFLLRAAAPAVLTTVLLCAVLFPRLKRRFVLHVGPRFSCAVYPFPRLLSSAVALLLAFSTLTYSLIKVDAPSYFRYLTTRTTFIEDHYVDPKETSITFPQQKQNLIVIYLESMETTFLSEELGGGNDVNVIPELYQLACDNVNFSSNDSVGGFRVLTGSTWIIAALVSLTAGVPLKAEFVGDAQTTFLPGLTTLSDILHQNGYYQALMVGSDSNFASRKQFYQGHQTDRVYDLFTAREDGIVPEDYYVWWGMEDSYLFQYAKQELTKIAAQEQPFAFSMLTVDTHHIGGYKCDLCGDEYPEQYENVLACSSRQVAEFVEWIQQQDFYQNTTIVITGDHCSMDGEYAMRNIPSSYDRKVYNRFINPVVMPADPKNRDFCSLDMFPTILASIGCSIEGDRLGLGTNLFSSRPTLCEELSPRILDTQLSNYSSFYNKEFL